MCMRLRLAVQPSAWRHVGAHLMGKKQKRAGFSTSSGSGFIDAARSNRSSSSTSSADPLPLPWLLSADKFSSASTLARLSSVGCDTLSLPSPDEGNDVGAQVEATVAACSSTGLCGASAGCNFLVPSSLPRRRSGPASCTGVPGAYPTGICVLRDVGDWGCAAPSHCVEEKRHCGAARVFGPCPHDMVSCVHICTGSSTAQCWTSAIGGYAGLLCTLCDKTAEASQGSEWADDALVKSTST